MLKPSALVLTASLVAPTAASAQVADIAWASAVTADYVTTARNMKYFHEKNPLLAGLDDKPKAMIALGAGIDAGSYFLWKDMTKGKPTLRKIGLFAAAGFRTWLAVRNARAYAKNRDRINYRRD